MKTKSSTLKQIRLDKDIETRLNKAMKTEPAWRSLNHIANAAIRHGVRTIEGKCEVEN